jgi:Flp pilus assembly protein TadG
MQSPRAQRRAGQALVEFALVVPFLLVILLVVIDVGRAIFAFNTVAEAARTAARVAIVDQNPTDITNVVINDPRTKWLGLTSANVSFPTPTCSPSSTTLVVGSCIASVTVTYQLNPFFFAEPSVQAGLPLINLSSTSAMPIERVYP